MPIERKQIVKSYLLLCEGKDAEGFLINYLNCNELAQDQRLSEEIQVMDFGGNDDLSSFLMNHTGTRKKSQYPIEILSVFGYYANEQKCEIPQKRPLGDSKIWLSKETFI